MPAIAPQVKKPVVQDVQPVTDPAFGRAIEAHSKSLVNHGEVIAALARQSEEFSKIQSQLIDLNKQVVSLSKKIIEQQSEIASIRNAKKRIVIDAMRNGIVSEFTIETK